MDTKTELVGKLIALAEQAATAEEAANAYAKVQAIASKYEIDLAVARAKNVGKTIRETPIARTVSIGAKGVHANKPLISLFYAVSEVNDVNVVIYDVNTRLVITGFPSDLDTVESIWMSAAATMTRLGNELVNDKNAAWHTETVWVDEYDEYGYWVNTVEKPVGKRGARRSFYDGFINSFGAELRKIRAEAVKESDERNFAEAAVAAIGAAPTGSTGTALVLKEKLAEVEQAKQVWYEAKHGKGKRPGSWNGDSNARHSTSMTQKGRAAGSKAAKDISSPSQPEIES